MNFKFQIGYTTRDANANYSGFAYIVIKPEGSAWSKAYASSKKEDAINELNRLREKDQLIDYKLVYVSFICEEINTL